MKIQYGFFKETYRTDENIEEQLGKDWKKKIFEVVFTNIISQIYPQGIKGPQARSCNRILDALDNAPEVYIKLDVADAEFVKSVFFHEQASVLPAQARVFCLLQDAIEEAFRKEQGNGADDRPMEITPKGEFPKQPTGLR